MQVGDTFIYRLEKTESREVSRVSKNVALDTAFTSPVALQMVGRQLGYVTLDLKREAETSDIALGVMNLENI